ncbi:hypothetical protein [Chryseobacterium sp. EO14]|uniref:hypothetical protein n=1 Tax=Chryseobacterium sp. EO14 TaxID=2950551 RepID=UPI002108B5EB|nr:hypothetical protein [Chryseobacterium sp. EO14]MCQ4142566.1 hypothetical protein [Chryseobacterium sp. EO14]
MTLYYISIGLDYDKYSKNENKYRYDFQLRTRFISNFFSKAVRKLRFKTDGTFNMISIALHEGKIKQPSISLIDVLKVELPFDRILYEKVKDTQACNFYLDLLEEGFKNASKFKAIPLDELLLLISEFRIGNCKNEWLLKKKKFKEKDIEIILTGEFTTNYFQVVTTVNQLSKKKELVKEVIIRTEPDEIVFENLIKDFKLIENQIEIINKFDDVILTINIDKLFERILDFNVIGNKKFKKDLSYRLNILT